MLPQGMVNLDMASGNFSNTATIASGAQCTSAIPLGNLELVGLKIPAITSSNVTFNVSTDSGTTWQTMQTDSTGPTGGSYYVAAGSGNIYAALSDNFMFGVDYLQICTSNQAQTSAIVFGLHVREKR
jgi:hypothetical protein